MHSDEIERRLRLPAHDEPSFLPPLLLPQAAGGFELTGRRVRAGSTGGSLRLISPRLAIALIALLAALVAATVSGALRIDRLFDRLPAQIPFLGDGVTLDIPGGWVQLTPNDPLNRSFAMTTLVVANRDVEGCAADDLTFATQPPPNVITPAPGESGDVIYEIPQPDGPAYSGIEDQVFACIVDAPMTPGEVRVAVSLGPPQEIGIGPIEAFDPTSWFGSEATLGDPAFMHLPSEETGWTEVIDEMPAKLVITEGGGDDGADEIRTWGIYDTRVFSDVWFVRASLRGPGLDELRSRADEIARSLVFTNRPRVLDSAQRDVALTTVIDNLDRELRLSQGSRIAGCFPRSPGEQTVVIEDGPGGSLLEPVTVTCATSIEETALHLWRAQLLVSWPAGDDYPAGTWGRELLFSADDLTAGGSGDNDPTLVFPGTTSPTAAPANEPLDLRPGTTVQLLAPGIHQEDALVTESWNNPHEIIRDRFVFEAQPGRRFAIVDGPISHNDAEWYLVEAPFGGTSYPYDYAWLPVTHDGFQLVRVVDPACLPNPTVADLLRLQPAERVQCHGDASLTLGPVTAIAAESFGTDPEGDPQWLVDAPWRLHGERGPAGVDGSLPMTFDPAVVDGMPVNVPLTVTGHFDDPTAATCAWREPSDWAKEPPDLQHLRCSEIFVVTAIEGRE